MRTNVKRIAAGAACAALCACQATGNGRAFGPDGAGSAALTSALRIGTTTKAQAAQAYGHADVHRFDNGYEAWTYQKTSGLPKFVNDIPYVNLFAPRMDGRTSELALLFDADGILRNVDRRGPPQP